MPPNNLQPCPVCNHNAFDTNDFPGSFAICPNCGWEDDSWQLDHPTQPGGANQMSLHQAQQNFSIHGSIYSSPPPKIQAVVDKLRHHPWSYEGHQGYRICIFCQDKENFFIEEGHFHELHRKQVSAQELIDYLKEHPRLGIFDWALSQ